MGVPVAQAIIFILIAEIRFYKHGLTHVDSPSG